MAAEDQATSFADWLREAAERRGYALSEPGRRAGGSTQLATDAGVPQSVVSRVLSGSTKPSPETVLKLGRVLFVSPTEALLRAGFPALARLVQVSPETRAASRVLDRLEAADLDEATKLRLVASYRQEASRIDAHFIEMIETALNARRQALAAEDSTP